MPTKPDKSIFDTKCETWPDCRCGERWRHWDRQLTIWNSPFVPAPTPDDVEWALIDVFLMLNCIAAHCPAPRFRRKACSQLMQPVFAGERDAERQRAAERRRH